MKRFLIMLTAMLMIPYVTTLAWTGRIRTDAGKEVMAEDFLVGVLAAGIPAEYGIETLKAQAVLARTDIWRIAAFDLEENDPDLAFPEEALDMDCLSVREMEREWGLEHFEEYYEKMKQAVRETEGLVVTYDGDLIEPFSCLAASGKTRELVAYPYLCSAESPGDLEADGFLKIRTFTEAEFARRIRGIAQEAGPESSGIAEKIQIIERDEAGYVKQVLIGGAAYDGDQVRDALGLPSSCFHFSLQDGKIRVTSKGIGSGYGFSQAGANAMEMEEGSGFEDLLKHYFYGIEIVKIR